MKRFRFLAVAVGLALVASQATAGSGSMNDFPLKALPVLVNVDATGKITEASPAMQLPPAVQRILLTNLDEMVAGPAHLEGGKPISSQCIINVYLKATPRTDGKFDAGFGYVSSQPVPIGRWHWVNLDGRRLMLANDDFRQRYYPDRFGPAERRSFNPPANMHNAAMPTMAPQPAAAPAPAAGRQR